MDEKESLDWLYEKACVSLNDKQKAFLHHFIFKNKGHGVLSGIAGSGKSTVMSLLKKYYGDEIVFFGASGVASLNLPDNIGVGTGHSCLSLPTKPATELNYKKVSPKCSNLFASSDLVKIIVIDEAYSYNSDTLDVIWRRIERFNKRTSKRKARNIRLLLVGDSGQMVTIADEDLKKELQQRWGSHLMFRSTVWDRFNFTHYVFDKVERQDDKVFKACLDVIRYNQTERYDKCLSWLNKRYTSDYSVDSLVLAARNKTVDKINKQVLDKNPNVKTHFPVKISGKFDMRDVLIREDGITLCEGLSVMTVNNDKDDRWVNGLCGVVTQVVGGEGCYVRFDNGNVEFVDKFTWENKEVYIEKDVVQENGEVKDELKERVLGRLTALPVVYSSSFSVSKAQGLTISRPFVIDMEETWLYTWEKMKDFGQNFLYIALSRATSVDMITLATPIRKEHIKSCKESIAFWRECCKKSVI